MPDSTDCHALAPRRVSARRTRRTTAAAATAGALLAGLVAPTGPAAAGPPRSGEVTDGPVVGALRSMPAYAAPAARHAKTARSWGGAADTVVKVGTAAGSQAVWGDWDGDGAHTPGTFNGGTWTLWRVAVGRAPEPDATVTGFGAVGDVAVTGDWDGDGRTDLGVYRAGTFFLTSVKGALAGAATTRVAFGQSGDLPLAGDWDGDGRDEVAVRRGAEFYFQGTPEVLQPAPPDPKPKPTPTPIPTPGSSPGSSPGSTDGPGKPPKPEPAPKPKPMPSGIPATSTRLAFGTAADEPVAGDWDGDGRDTVGVVRGRTWSTRNDLQPGPATRVVVVDRPADAVPLPWRVPVGDGSSCPYVASAPVSRRADANAALVVAPLGLREPSSFEDVEGKARTALGNAQRYLMGAGHTPQTLVRRPYPDLLGLYTPGQVEIAVRGPAMRALTLAVGLSTQTWDDATLAASAEQGRAHVRWLVRGIACQHAAFTPGGWGYGWQTAHWANLAGLAAWLTWDELAPQEREYAATMVVAEADRLLTNDVAYWSDLAGVELAIGDSKAEENSWNAALLELAVAMMPEHERAGLWRRKAIDFEVASFATVWDTQSEKVVNGTAVKARLSGFNAEGDGVIVNQGLRNPDYFTTVQQNWWAAAFARLGGAAAPEAATYQADRQWDVMTKRAFTRTAEDGTLVTRPVYAPDGTIFFPEGSRWGTGRRAQFVAFDAFRLLTTTDSAERDEAVDYLSLHLDGQLALQARNPDGRTYLPGEDAYPGREEYAASQVALAWLALYVDAWMPIDAADREAYGVLPRMAGLTPAEAARPQAGSQSRSQPGAQVGRQAVRSSVELVGPVGPVARSVRRPSP